MRRKLGSILIILALIFSAVPANCFASEDEEPISVFYPGDVTVNVKSDVLYNQDLSRGVVEAKDEGKLVISVKSNTSRDLEKVKVYSALPSSSGLNYNTLEGEFLADENGVVNVTINLKKDRVYCLFKEFGYISIFHTGDVAVNVISDMSYNCDPKRGVIETKKEGKIVFDVKSNIYPDLKTVKVYSTLKPNPSSSYDYDIFEGEYTADDNGVVNVTINLKKDKTYCLTTEFNESKNLAYIYYSGDVLVNVISGKNYNNNPDCGEIGCEKEGTITFDIKSAVQTLKIKNVKIYSGVSTDSLGNVDYSTLEGEFPANSSGISTVTLDVKAGKTFVLEADFVDDPIGIIKQEISKIRPVVSTSKASKGIKISIKTSSRSIRRIKESGGRIEYKIYRATKKNGKYTLKKTTKSASYTDTSVKKGHRYYYKVRIYVKDKDGNSLGSTSLSKSNISSRTYK